MILAPLQIVAVMHGAGFPLEICTTMTAIALRESGGNPAAVNINPLTKDRSYGLVQINMKDPNVAGLINRVVLKGRPETALLDPATNALAAFVLWNGSNSNLNIAWYIAHVNADGTPTAYKTRYEAHLPEAQAAVLAFNPKVIT